MGELHLDCRLVLIVLYRLRMGSVDILLKKVLEKLVEKCYNVFREIVPKR